MPNYKLTYLDCRALGEPIRLIFAAAEVEFEDNRIPLKDFHEVKKHGFGQVPVLEVDYDVITQSITIARFLGNKFKMNPKDELLVARCDEVVDFVTELRLEFRAWLTEYDEEKKAVIREHLLTQVFPKYYPILNELVLGDFIAGNGEHNMSWADLVLANWLQIWGESGIPTPEFMKDFPALVRVQESVFNVPPIARYLRNRPVTPF